MPVGATIGAVGSLGSAALGYFGSQNAANAQVQAQQQALQQQNKMFGVLQGATQPLINRGSSIMDSTGGVLKNLLTPGANQTAALSQLPGFQFAQDWGQKAVRNQGTTMGLGGNTLSSGAQYATGLAQQGFSGLTGLLQNFFNSGSGLAQSGVGALAGGATNFSGQASNTLGNIGNAQASGILGGANALSGGVQGATGGATNALLLSKLLGGGANPGESQASYAPGGIYSGAVPSLQNGQWGPMF